MKSPTFLIAFLITLGSFLLVSQIPPVFSEPPTLVWDARYDGPGHVADGAADLALDESGNVYVTGSSEGDYVTIKYDSDGNEAWVARYVAPV